MFTGIVTNIGLIKQIINLDQGKRIRILTGYDIGSIDIGASISCSGICLTVVDKGKTENLESWFDVEVWQETLERTTVQFWKIGNKINLERALKIGDELGGHLVSGHVDSWGEILDCRSEGEARRLFISFPEDLAKYIYKKGSITVDGVSLTINSVKDSVFDVLLIKHTQEVTTLGNVSIGNKVNLEVDMLTRIIVRLFENRLQKEVSTDE